MNRRSYTLALVLLAMVLTLATACAANVTPPTNEVDSPTPTTEVTGEGDTSMADLEDVIWVLTGYGPEEEQVTPLEGTEVTATFDGEMIAGSAGCNSYGGAYALDGQTLTISDLAQTLMACADQGIMDQETAFISALISANSFTLDGDILTIQYDGGMLRFTAAPPLADASLEGTFWLLTTTVTEDAAQSLVMDTEITAQFSDGQVTGSAGCNSYSGGYTVDGQQITIGEIVQTEMACEGAGIMEQEAMFTTAMQSVETFAIEGNTLSLTHSGGSLVFTASE